MKTSRKFILNLILPVSTLNCIHQKPIRNIIKLFSTNFILRHKQKNESVKYPCLFIGATLTILLLSLADYWIIVPPSFHIKYVDLLTLFSLITLIGLFQISRQTQKFVFLYVAASLTCVGTIGKLFPFGVSKIWDGYQSFLITSCLLILIEVRQNIYMILNSLSGIIVFSNTVNLLFKKGISQIFNSPWIELTMFTLISVLLSLKIDNWNIVLNKYSSNKKAFYKVCCAILFISNILLMLWPVICSAALLLWQVISNASLMLWTSITEKLNELWHTW